MKEGKKIRSSGDIVFNIINYTVFILFALMCAMPCGYDVGSSANNRAQFFYYPCVRYDLYKEIGSPEIKTLEDYVSVFEEMKKKCPKSDTGKETYAVSMFSAWDGDMVMFVKATAALYGYDEFGFGLYDLEKQEYQDALDPNGMYLRCLKFYNTLNQKGLVKPDSVSQTFDDCLADYKDGAAFFNLFTWMSGDVFNTAEHTKAGKAMYAIPPQDAKNYCVLNSNRTKLSSEKLQKMKLRKLPRAKANIS